MSHTTNQTYFHIAAWFTMDVFQIRVGEFSITQRKMSLELALLKYLHAAKIRTTYFIFVISNVYGRVF